MSAGEFSEARTMTCTVAADSGSIERGSALQLVGEREITLATGDGTEAFGIAQAAPRAHPVRGEHVTVVLKGARNAAVAAAVTANDRLVVGADGTLRPVADGERAPSGGEFRALTDADNGGALVLLR